MRSVRILSIIATAGALAGGLFAVAPATAAVAPAKIISGRPVERAAQSTMLRAAATAVTVNPKVSGCDGAITLGATTQCQFSAPGTATYTLSTAGPDRLRIRAAEPTFTATPAVVVRDPNDAAVCSHAGSDQFDCPVSAAGAYTIEISVSTAVTVYTTVDSVRDPADCAASVSLSTSSPGIPIPISAPGASFCSYLPGTHTGDVLRFAFRPTTDDFLHVAVYAADGTPACAVAVLFNAVECTVASGSGYRMFVDWGNDATTNTVLYASRLSHPSGCLGGDPDPFGAAPARSGLVHAFRVRCFLTTTSAGHPLAVNVVAAQPQRVLSWSVRAPDGTPVCSGDTSSGAMSCPATVSGAYALIVAGPTGSSVGPTTRVTALLAAVLDSPGCVSVASTAFGAAAQPGTLPPGQVDCYSFAGQDGHRIQITPWSLGQHAGAMLVDPNGAAVCRFSLRTTCTLPHSTGTYRVLVWSFGTTDPVDYRLWVTDQDSTAGCTATTADAFGVAPSRTGELDDSFANQCWTFAATKGAAYLISATTESGNLYAQVNVVQRGGGLTCQTTSLSHTGCRIAHTGTYLIIVNQYAPQFDPSEHGVVRVGLWQIDGAPGCTVARTSFTAPAISGAFTGPDQVDCATVTTTGTDVITVNAGGAPDLALMHQVYDSTGRRLCVLYPGDDCRLRRAGTYLVLTFSVAQRVEPYTLSVRSVTDHNGCPGATVRNFGTAPERAFQVQPGIPACVVFTRSATAGRVLLSAHTETGAAPRFVLHDADGSRSCFTTGSVLPACVVSGTGPFVLVIYGWEAAAGVVGSYSATDSAGCVAAPSGAFDAPPARGSIRRPAEVDCFDLGSSAVRRQLRFAIGSAPAGSVLHLRVLDSAGSARCETSSANYFRWLNCSLRAGLSVRLVVWLEDGQPVVTGKYAVHVWELIAPTGCVQLGSAADGFGPVLGRFADPNDENCYQFSVPAATSLHLTADDPDASTAPPWVDVHEADGRLICEIDRAGTCTLPHAATYTMIAFGRSGVPDYTDRYRIVATPS